MSLPSHLSRIKKNDQLLVMAGRTNSGKQTPGLIRVIKVLEESVVGVYMKDQHIKHQTLEVPLSAVLSNFGPDRVPVKVAGVDLDKTLFESEEIEHFGEVHWLYEPAPESKSKVEKGFQLTYKGLKRVGLTQLLDLPLVYELENSTGEYSGMYRSPKNLGKSPGVLTFCPEKTGANSALYVIAHEFGHVLDLEVLRHFPKHRAKWIELYATTVGSVPVDPTLIKRILKQAKGCTSYADFKALIVEEDEKKALKIMMQYIKVIRGMDFKDINLLLRAGNYEQLAELWPSPDWCIQSELKPLVSKYATVKPAELFAESFAFYVCGTKLPKIVTSLIEESIQRGISGIPRVLSKLKEGTPQSDD